MPCILQEDIISAQVVDGHHHSLKAVALGSALALFAKDINRAALELAKAKSVLPLVGNGKR